MGVKLTERVVADLATTGQDHKVFDAQIPGFHIRVSGRGTKSYGFFYRNADGRQRTIKIGRVGVLKCEQARKAALGYASDVQAGKDPSGERHEQRTVITTKDLYEDYLEKHARVRKKPRSVQMDEILWRRHLSNRFATKRVAHVSRRDIDAFMASMSERRGAANRALALLSKMMSLAVAWNLRPDNPCKGAEKYQERRLERFLSPEEAKRLIEALDGDSDVCGTTAIRLLMLTGARRSEVLLAQWSQFDLDREDPMWVVPKEHIKGATKVKSDLRRPLSKAAADLLRAWRANSAILSIRWVFPSPKDATKSRPDLKSTWDRVRAQAGLGGVRLHDLRHSFASTAINSGATLYAVSKALGHADVRTTVRYAHLVDDSIRSVAQAVAGVYGS